MRFNRKTTDGTLLLQVGGVLRASPHSIEFFNEVVASVAKPLTRLDLDLGSVLFIDSLWLGFLVSLTVKCRNAGIEFRIIHVSRQVWRVVEQAHLDSALPAPEDIQAAKPAPVHASRHAAAAVG